jgi:tetratricopeptide (TPR) repeat protein
VVGVALAAVPAGSVAAAGPRWQAPGESGSASTKAQEYYRRGVEFMNNSRYLDAVEQFQLALDEDPSFVDAHRRIAYAYTQMAQTESDYWLDALDQYEEVKAITGDEDVEVRRNIAFVQAAMGDLDDAIATYEEIIAVTPNDCVVWEQIGTAHKLLADQMQQDGDEGDPEYAQHMQQAVDSYVKVTELCPDSSGAYNTLGEIYFASDQKEKAAAIYEKIAEMNPDNVDALIRLAYIYKDDAPDQAAVVYGKILAIAPERDDIRSAYAKSLKDAGKFQEAIVQYETLLKSDPTKYGSIYCTLANIYAYDLNDAEKTIEICLEGISQNAPVVPCLNYFWGKGLELRGTNYMKEYNYDRAISTYREAKIKFQNVIDDPNFGAPAKKQLERLDQLIQIGEQTKEKARQNR